MNNFLSGLEDTIEELNALSQNDIIQRLARLERVVYQQQKALAFLITDLGLLSHRCNEVGNTYNNDYPNTCYNDLYCMYSCA